MKRGQFLMSVLVGAILLSGLGLVKAVGGQSAPDRSENLPIFLPSDLPYESFEMPPDFDPNSIPMEDAESDPAIETQNLEREFAGTNLTAAQFEQVRQVRRRFRSEMAEAMKSRFPLLMLAMFLPQERAEALLGNILGSAISNYGEGVAEILTPEQLAIWQQNMNAYVENNQQ